MKVLFELRKENQQRQMEKMVWVYPAYLAMFATFLRNNGDEVVWEGNNDGSFDRIVSDDRQVDVPFNKLPFPDRKFTKAKDRKWQLYGNYRYHPASHSMVSNLCWYSLCTFCSDTERVKLGEKRFVRSVGHFIEEIDDLIANEYREVFDDSGTFPVGDWLLEFRDAMNQSPKGKSKRRKDYIHLGINMKPIKMDYKILADCGVGFTLVGIESANQKTVDTIKKGQKSEEIIPILTSMNKAGLKIHLTSMFGYEFENHDDAMRTVELVHHLLKKGIIKTAQASVYSPPRTQPDPNSHGHKYIPMIYDAYRSPEFWYHKIKDIRKWEDVTYMARGGRLIVEEKWRKLTRNRSEN